MKIRVTISVRMRILWIVAIMILVVSAGAFTISRRIVQARNQNTLFTVRRGELQLTVPAIGSLEAERATEIGPPYVDGLWDFKVIRLIPEGSEVKEGDLLIEFDEEGVTRRIGEQRASIERAQEEIRRRRLEKNVQLSDLRIRAEEARVNLERAKNKASVDPQLTSMQDYRQIQIQLEMATNEAFRVQEKLKATTKMYDAQIAALQSSLKTAEERMKRLEVQQTALRVTAPIPGIVIYQRNRDGEKKAIGQSAWREEVIMQIPDLSSLRMAAMVQETDSGEVRPGQKTKIRLDAFPEIELNGIVTSVGNILRTKSRDLPVKVIDVSIRFDPPEARLLPGMTATALIEVERLDNILLIPLTAVRERNGRTVVRLEGPEGEAVERFVRLGRRDSQSIEVLEGLKEGERIFL
jgi:HlyD family secretion protein